MGVSEIKEMVKEVLMFWDDTDEKLIRDVEKTYFLMNY